MIIIILEWHALLRYGTAITIKSKADSMHRRCRGDGNDAVPQREGIMTKGELFGMALEVPPVGGKWTTAKHNILILDVVHRHVPLTSQTSSAILADLELATLGGNSSAFGKALQTWQDGPAKKAVDVATLAALKARYETTDGATA